MMSNAMLLLCMVFAHIVDDFILQQLGNLHNMKQIDWWIQQAPPECKYDEKARKQYAHKYHLDFLVALLIHSFSWSFMILLPIFILTSFQPAWWIYLILVANLVIHAIVDDLKANKHKINLVTDQGIHFVQILVTWLLYILI